MLVVGGVVMALRYTANDKGLEVAKLGQVEEATDADEGCVHVELDPELAQLCKDRQRRETRIVWAMPGGVDVHTKVSLLQLWSVKVGSFHGEGFSFVVDSRNHARDRRDAPAKTRKRVTDDQHI